LAHLGDHADSLRHSAICLNSDKLRYFQELCDFYRFVNISLNAAHERVNVNK